MRTAQASPDASGHPITYAERNEALFRAFESGLRSMAKLPTQSEARSMLTRMTEIFGAPLSMAETQQIADRALHNERWLRKELGEQEAA